MAFSHPEDVPTIDVIPLFEQLEDLQNSVDVLEEMIKIPEVQARLKATGNKLEVMLGYLTPEGRRPDLRHAGPALRSGAHCQVG